MNQTIPNHINQFSSQAMNLEPNLKDFKITFTDEDGDNLVRAVTAESRSKAESVLIRFYGNILFLGFREL